MKDWRISSVLLTGLHHINEDTPGQDNLEIIRLENGFCAALADGVGSLAYSQIASMLATRTTVSWLADQAQTLLSLPDETARREYTARNLLEQIRTVLHQQAQRQQISIKKMDCNLAFCFLDAAAQTAIIGQLGDCAVCLLADDAGDAIRERASVVLSDRGGLANSTCTVMSQSAAERLTVTVVDLEKRRCRGILLTSDGLDGVVYRKNSTLVKQQTQDIFNEVYGLEDQDYRDSQLKRKLESIRDDSGGYLDDDISLILFSCGETPLKLARDPHWPCRCGHRNPLDVTYCANCAADMLRLYKDVDFSACEYGMDGYFLEHSELTPEPPEAPALQEPAAPEPQPPKTEPIQRIYVVEEEPLPEEEVVESRPRRSEREVTPRPKRTGKKAKASIGGAGQLYAGASPKKPREEQTGTETVVDTVPVPKGSHSGQSEAPKPARNPVLMGVLILTAVILLFWLATQLRDLIPDPGPENPGPQTVQTGPGPSQPVSTQPVQDGNYLRLGSDRYYIGEADGRVPNGYGTLVDGTRVYTGLFERGSKNGIFTVTDFGGTPSCRVVVFRDDREEEVLYNSALALTRTRCQLVYPLDTLYEDSNYSAERKAVDLKAGDIVYLTDTPPVTAEHSGTVWMQIELADGTVGWCTSRYLAQIIELPASEPTTAPDLEE